MKVKILKDIAEPIVGTNEQSYGPFGVGDVVELPPENAQVFADEGYAEVILPPIVLVGMEPEQRQVEPLRVEHLEDIDKSNVDNLTDNINNNLKKKLKEKLKQFLSTVNITSKEDLLLRYNANGDFAEFSRETVERVIDEAWGKNIVKKGVFYEWVEENPFSTDKLEFYTNHLPLFSEFDRATRLYGNEYIVIKKACWYNIFSIPLRKVKIILGDITADCRMHVAYSMPTGSGKKNLVDVIERICQAIHVPYAEPTSYHPEQLIGKIIRRGKRNPIYERIEGHLADDVNIFEDAIDLLRSNETSYKEARKYLIKALDPFGSNTIQKRMVDTPRSETLEYTPDCIISMFFQPYSLDEEIVLVGLLRRFIVPFVRLKQFLPIENYGERVYGSDELSTANAIQRIVDKLNEIAGRVRDDIKITFTENAKRRFLDLHLELIKQGLMHSQKGRNYIRLIDYDLQDKLLKVCVVLALARKNETVIDTEDVELAFLDMTEFLACNLDFVNTKILGYLDYGEQWGGARKEDADILKWLWEQGATSKEESRVSISEYISKIAEVCGLTTSGATAKYRRHKKNGWVDSEQVGSIDTKVWLLVRPAENISVGCMGDTQGLSRSNLEYFKILEKFKNQSNILNTLESKIPLPCNATLTTHPVETEEIKNDKKNTESKNLEEISKCEELEEHEEKNTQDNADDKNTSQSVEKPILNSKQVLDEIDVDSDSKSDISKEKNGPSSKEKNSSDIRVETEDEIENWKKM